MKVLHVSVTIVSQAHAPLACSHVIGIICELHPTLNRYVNSV